MKRFILPVVLTVGLALGIGLTTIPAAHATTNYCGGIQTAIEYQGQAWNNWNGNAKDGNPINYYDSTTANNSQWCLVNVGTVQDGEGGVIWPFVDGSGLNTRYNGDPVFEVVWGPTYTSSQEYCASGNNFAAEPNNPGGDDGENDLATCEPSGTYNSKTYDEYYVYSAYDYFANVYTNNQSWTVFGRTYLIPELVGDAFQGDGNGANVFNDYNDSLPFTCTVSGVCQNS